MVDIIFAVVMLVAITRGYRKGLIVALFSIIAFIVGLAAALKLSAAVALRLQDNITGISRWLPVISFALVFLVIVLVVHLIAKLIQKSFELAMLGWANRAGGILLYILLYAIIYSIFLFYAQRMNRLSPSAIEGSVVYPIIEPIGPKVIDYFAQWLPVFKDSFLQLEAFFERVSNKIQH